MIIVQHDCEKNGFASNRSWKASLLAGSGVYDGREVGAAKMSPTGLSKVKFSEIIHLNDC